MHRLFIATLCLAACSDGPSKRGIGSTCQNDAQCESGLCLEDKCFDPLLDDDLDTLTNALEGELGTSPTKADSDGDGVADRDELGASFEALDSDGDGLIDAIESNEQDLDFDCLPDQEDVDNGVADPLGCVIDDHIQVDCFAHLVNRGAASAVELIDPLETGTPFEVECEQQLAGGGWTRLIPGVVDATAEGVSEYLFTNGNGWLRAPLSAGGWSWETGRSVPGQWFSWSPTFAQASTCSAGSPQGVGVGCTYSEGPVYVDLAGSDPSTGTARLCLPGFAPFPTEADGCVEDLKVYWRRSPCRASADEVLGDPTLASLRTSACWRTFPINTQLARDGEPPPGETGTTLVFSGGGGDGWSYDVEQNDLTLSAGHAYRLRVWLRASEPLTVHLTVGTALGQDFFDHVIQLDTTWRLYERGFTPPLASHTGRFALQLAGQADTTVSLFGLDVDDLGSSVCAPASSTELTADRSFDQGAVCWEVDDGNPPPWVTTDATTSAPQDEASPILAVSDDALTTGAAVLRQNVGLLTSERVYAVTGWFSSVELGEAQLIVRDETTTHVDQHTTFAEGSWTSALHRFVLHGVAHTVSTADLIATITPPEGGVARVDGLGVIDVGPNPCVPPAPDQVVADPLFGEGLLCWQRQLAAPERGAFYEEYSVIGSQSAAPAVLFEPGTLATPPRPEDVRLVQPGRTVTFSGFYLVEWWARAATATTMVVRVVASDGTELFDQEVNVPTQWSQFGFDFTSPMSDGDTRVELLFGATDAVVWVDDLSITSQTF